MGQTGSPTESGEIRRLGLTITLDYRHHQFPLHTLYGKAPRLKMAAPKLQMENHDN